MASNIIRGKVVEVEPYVSKNGVECVAVTLEDHIKNGGKSGTFRSGVEYIGEMPEVGQHWLYYRESVVDQTDWSIKQISRVARFEPAQ